MKEPKKQERLLANSFLIYAEKLKSSAAFWGEKISGKCKKLLSEPCLVHSVPLCVPCSFGILVLCYLLGHVPAQGRLGKWRSLPNLSHHAHHLHLLDCPLGLRRGVGGAGREGVPPPQALGPL